MWRRLWLFDQLGQNIPARHAKGFYSVYLLDSYFLIADYRQFSFPLPCCWDDWLVFPSHTWAAGSIKRWRAQLNETVCCLNLDLDFYYYGCCLGGGRGCPGLHVCLQRGNNVELHTESHQPRPKQVWPHIWWIGWFFFTGSALKVLSVDDSKIPTK